MVKHSDRRGFSLLEVLVSVGIIAFLGTTLTQILFSITRSSAKTEVLKDVKQNGEFSLQLMERYIRNARTITSTCTASGTSLDSLSFVNPDGGTTSFYCLSDGKAIRIASSSASGVQFLTSNSVTLGASCATSSLVFVCTASDDVPKSIHISFQLAQIGTPVDQFEKAGANFQTTILLRNK